MMFKLNEKFTKSFILSETIYNGFIDLFNDRNPMHTNNDFAIQKGFQGKVMHGNILNGFLSYLVGECLPTKNVIIHSQEIHFKNPIYLNDVIHLEAIVREIYLSVNAIVLKFHFRNDQAKIVSQGKIQVGILE